MHLLEALLCLLRESVPISTAKVGGIVRAIGPERDRQLRAARARKELLAWKFPARML